MYTEIEKINETIKWKDLTEGCIIVGSKTSEKFNTGEWRVNSPVFLLDKCKQCLMCIPTCPDSSIPVEDKLRKDFDFEHCKGCGICAKVCPFGAIEMKGAE